MSKITIEIEDTGDGSVRFKTTPSRRELKNMPTDNITPAYMYGIHAITEILKKDKEKKENVKKLTRIIT